MLSSKAQQARSSWNWLGLIGSLALLLVCFLFGLPAILSGNLLFATDIITGEPVQVMVYHHGASYTFEPGDPEYDLIVEAANTTLGQEAGYYEWGWSEERFEQARSEGIAVELIYADPVKIPGNRVDIADPTRLFFPLEVFGADGEVVFRGGHREYWGLPIRVHTLDRMREVTETIVSQQ